MAHTPSGRYATSVDVESYDNTGGETTPAAVELAPYSTIGLACYAASISGGVGASGAVCTVRLYADNSGGVFLCSYSVTLDSSGRGADGSLPVASPNGSVLYWSFESDTDADYTVVLQLLAPDLGG